MCRLAFGGSLIRPEATGYGLVYFVDNILQDAGDSFKVRPVHCSQRPSLAQLPVCLPFLPASCPLADTYPASAPSPCRPFFHLQCTDNQRYG